MEEHRQGQHELRDYLSLVRRQRWLIVIAVVSVAVAAFAASLLQEKVYGSSAQVLLKTSSSDSIFTDGNGAPVVQNPQRNVRTEIAIFESRSVKEVVRARLGEVPPITVNPVGDTDVVEVVAENRDPEAAALIANTYSQAYIAVKRRQQVDDLLAAAQEIQHRIDALQVQIDQLQRVLAARPPGSADPRIQSLVTQQAFFRQQLDELRVDAGLQSGGARVTTPATASTEPVRPKPLNNAILGIVLGLFFGVVVAVIVDFVDDSLRSAEDIKRVDAKLPTLGLIPIVAGWKDHDRPTLVTRDDPTAPPAEAYRSLRTAVQFVGGENGVRVLQVTSARAAEGKTTTVANLGVTLANAGQRVLILSCDLRRPRIHTFFDLPNEHGFTSVVNGEVPLSAAILAVPGVERLHLLSAGPPPPNPSELLASTRAKQVLATVAREFDVVLVDSPPLLPVADSVVLAQRVDGVLLVASVGRTSRRALGRALELLRQVKAPVLGSILNEVDQGATDAYGYGYYYRYELRPESVPVPSVGNGQRVAASPVSGSTETA